MQIFDANNFSLDEQHLLKTAQAYDQRILAAAEGPLSTEQTADLLTWAHRPLLATVINILQSSAKAKRHRVRRTVGTGIRFCLDCIDVISLLLSGEATVDQTLNFRAGASLGEDDRAKLAIVNGERPVDPKVMAFGHEVVARFRHQLTRVAKRTRSHSQAEIDAIWQTADTSLLTCALKWFHLAEPLDLPFPFPEPEVAALLYVETAKGYLSVAWTIRGPVFAMVKRPPGYPLAIREGLPA